MADESIAFDRAAGFYDETRGFPPGIEQPVGDLIARAGHITSDSRVLEVGIGTGRVGLPTSTHAAAYFGIDLSTGMMGQLRAKQTSEPVYLAQADATRLPFADHTFDAAVAVHVFHLIPGWQQALAEVARVLRPGAPLLSCYNGSDNHPQIKMLWDAWNRAVPEARRQTVGARPDDDPEFIEKQGWVRDGQEHIYTYPITFSVQRHVDRLRRRVWSRLWQLTDDEMNAGVAAVEAAVAEHFDSPSAEIQHTGQFHVQVHLPPN